MTVPSIRLTDDVAIPQLGFGVFQVPPDQTQDAVSTALEIGYRHIDTARIYDNEAGVGAAIAASGLSRDELFITTKLWNDDQGFDSAVRAYETSLAKLGLDYVDLYLIHWPAPESNNYVDAWKGLEHLLAEGRVRSIGVSNFRIADLERLALEGLSTPVINQVEVHPLFTNAELRAYHESHSIVTEAWSPLARGRNLTDPVLVAIAENHDRTPAQIILAWHLALGHVVIPKSVTRARIEENFAVFDIALSPEEIGAISGLNQDARIGPDPATFHP